MPNLSELAQLVAGKIVSTDHASPADSIQITGVADLATATTKDISFYAKTRYLADLKATKAGAILVAQAQSQSRTQQIVCNNPYMGMAKIAAFLYPKKAITPGIHETACIHETAQVDAAAAIGPYVVIDAHAKIAKHVVIQAHCFIGENTFIHENTHIYPGVKILADTRIGKNCIIHAGVVIGSDGFGYVPNEHGVHQKVLQLGHVEIADDVEIGANTTIDRATYGVTRIGIDTKIDNLVQIGHNVQIGDHCIIVSQTGIAGSTRLGDHIVLGAQTGVAGHIDVKSRSLFGGRTGITSDIDESGVYSGMPAMPHKQALRVLVSQKDLPNLRRKVYELEKRLETLVNSPAPSLKKGK